MNAMRARLEKIKFVSPRAGSLWTGPPSPWQHPALHSDRVSTAVSETFKSLAPLFLHGTAWHHIDRDQANAIALALGDIGIPVTVLRSEISNQNGESTFHDSLRSTEPSDRNQRRTRYYPRLVPYRPERYGLAVSDFDNATVIDIRLNTHRDETGRFAYSAEQLARWDLLKGEAPISGGSWVPSATFPPDVPNLNHLVNKSSQLRTLSKGAAIFITVDPFHLEDDLPGILNAEPDGIILQLECIVSDGLELAKFVMQTRKMMDQLGGQKVPLWVSPGSIDADDAAKLIALGASGIAIDSWFDHLWDEVESTSNSGYASRSHAANQANRLASEIQWHANRTMGLLYSLERLPRDQRLTSLDPTWCQSLGLSRTNVFS